jgi:hypothetical protein
MNERFKELAKQAGIKITPMIVDGIEYEYEDVDMDGSDDLEKFAELVIEEYAQEYQKLVNGDSVVLPKNHEHAENMVRVGIFYLDHNK